MSNFQYVISHSSPAYTRGREGHKPEFIVIHHWGVDGQHFDNVVRYLCRAGADTSAHYVAEGGRVACIVDCANTAWHAGNWEANIRSIGIECRPECTPQDMETVAQLVAEIRAVYGNLPLRTHDEFFATACPGRWKAGISLISKRADEINAQGKAKPASNPTAPSRTKQEKSNFTVRVSIPNLYIREGAGTNYPHKGFIQKGVYTIVATASGNGASQWGKLKSGAGWIALDFTTRVR